MSAHAALQGRVTSSHAGRTQGLERLNRHSRPAWPQSGISRCQHRRSRSRPPQLHCRAQPGSIAEERGANGAPHSTDEPHSKEKADGDTWASNDGAPGNGNHRNGSRGNGNGASEEHRSMDALSSYDQQASEDMEDVALGMSGGFDSNNGSAVTADGSVRLASGTIAEAEDSETAPRPASFWLPHPDAAPDSPPGEEQSLPVRARAARKAVMRAPKVAGSWVTYRIQQLMLSNTVIKIAALFMFALPAVLVGGELYSVITGKPRTEGFLKVYSVLYIIPGVNLLAENNLVAGVLLNAIFLLGTFTFAVILGVVSDDIGTEVKAIRSGNYPVLAEGHVLILNWNSNTIPLLRQLALAQREQAGMLQRKSVWQRRSATDIHHTDEHVLADKPIVVMAERCKTEMDAEVQQALKGYKVNWQTREGAPYSAADLAKVSAGLADTIVLLRPQKEGMVIEYQDDDSAATRRHRFHQAVAQREVAALLGINAGREATAAKGSSQRQNVIVQAPEDGTDVVTAVKKLMVSPGLNALGLKDRRDITRLVAQSALQPGVASVHASILQRSSNSVSFYLRAFPRFAGMTYGEVRRRFALGLICGYYSAARAFPLLNPPDSAELAKDDKLIVLSTTNNILPSHQGLAPEYSSFLEHGFEALHPAQSVHADTRHVLVAGWCGDIADLTHSLSIFAPTTSKTVVTVLCGCCPENFPEEMEESNVEFRYLCGDVEHSGALEEAGVPDADAIIIGPSETLPDDVSDANMLSTMVLISDILIEAGRQRGSPCHVVGVVRCPHSVKVANYMVRELSQGTMTAELLQPDELVSGLIAQVTSEPALAPLLSELIHSTEGQEVTLRDPSDYELDDLTPTPFAVVAEAARRKRETALGYVTRQGLLILAPAASDSHTFRNTDHLVVLSSSRVESTATMDDADGNL